MRLCQMLHLTPREQSLPQGFEAFMENLTTAVLGPAEPAVTPPVKRARVLSEDEQALSVARAITPSSASFLACSSSSSSSCRGRLSLKLSQRETP